MSKAARIHRERIVTAFRTHLGRIGAWDRVRSPHRGVRKRDHGHAGLIPLVPLYRGTTWHTCGLWPFTGTATVPRHGAPIGKHVRTGDLVRFDPLAWFDHDYMNSPSAFVLGAPGVGKSSFLRKVILGTIAAGDLAMVLGDRKPEYTRLFEELGEEAAQIVRMGPGAGVINVLDPGGVVEAIELINASCSDRWLAEELTESLLAEMHARRAQMVEALVEISRDAKLPLHEKSMIDGALRHLHTHQDGVPILADLRDVFDKAPWEIRKVTTNPDDDEVYRTETLQLRRDLGALCSGGGLGATFNGPTSQPLRRDRSVCFDISAIDPFDHDHIGAAYLAAWSAGFGLIKVARALSKAGLERKHRYQVVLDEFWQPMSAGPGMVDRSNAITRLDRNEGVGLIYATHTLNDLKAIRNPADIAKAQAIISNCGTIIVGGLKRDEIARIQDVVALNKREVATVLSWSRAPDWNSGGSMPGRGHFLIKGSEGQPGVPVIVTFSPTEIRARIHDTNTNIRRDQLVVAA